MKINEFNNLWCAKYEKENFTICVLAVDIYEAMEVAMEYFNDSQWEVTNEDITITRFRDMNTHFDCDYVIDYVI